MHLLVLCLQAQVSARLAARLCSPLGDGGCPAAAAERPGLGREEEQFKTQETKVAWL